MVAVVFVGVPYSDLANSVGSAQRFREINFKLIQIQVLIFSHPPVAYDAQQVDAVELERPPGFDPSERIAIAGCS